MADIIVPINERTDPETVAYDIMERVKKAAADALQTAGEQHIKTAKENVEMAYVLGEKKISLMYAWSLIPWEIQQKQTADENIAMAETIRDTKQGMVITGNLLQNISVGSLTEEGLNVSIELLSMAPYSNNLEWGILFGKERKHKRRRFFTGHIHSETIPTMVKEFYKNIRED